MNSPARALAMRLLRFGRDADATSAVEFALVLPFLIALLLGGTEVSTAVIIGRKVTLTAHTVTDLVSQNTGLTASQMTTILGASTQVLAPYNAANLSLLVTEVQTDSTGKKAKVVWSVPLSGQGLTAGTTVTLPTALQQPNTFYIWGSAQYIYTPNLGVKLTGPIPLNEQIYLVPRNSACVLYPSSPTSQTCPTSWS